MKPQRTALAIILAICLCLIAAAPAYAAQTAVVNNPNPADRLHLRTLPSTSALSLGKYYNGVEVRVLLDDGTSWVKVRVANVVGYMSRTYLNMGASSPIGGSRSIRTHLQSIAGASQPVYVRDRNNSAGKVVHIGYNDAIIVLAAAGSWYHIAVEINGGYTYGYVPIVNVKPFPLPSGGSTRRYRVSRI